MLNSGGGVDLAAGAGSFSTKQLAIFSVDSFTHTSGGAIIGQEIDIAVSSGNIGSSAKSPVLVSAEKLALQASGSVWASTDLLSAPVSIVDGLIDGRTVSNSASAIYQVEAPDSPLTLATGISADMISLNSGAKLSVAGANLFGVKISLTGDIIAVSDNQILAQEDSLLNGGNIVFNARNGFELGFASALVLNANGSNLGGSLSVTSSKDISIGSGAGQLSFNATGGTAGGAVTVDLRSGATSKMTVDPAAFNIAGGGADAKGGSVTLLSTKSVDFNVSMGTLNVNGKGTADGGSVDIETGALSWTGQGSNQPFNISANSGNSGGNGGRITILSSDSSSSLSVNANGLVLSAAAAGMFGNGGEVNVNVAGNLSFDSANVSSGNFGGNGGTLKAISANILSLTNNVYSVSSNASSSPGAGGAMVLQGKSILFSGPTSLVANGSVMSGNGGSVEITSGQTSDFSFDNLVISAASIGSTGSGNGGTIKVTTAGKLVVNPSFLQFGASSLFSGDGGKLYLQGSQVVDSASSTLKLSAPAGGALLNPQGNGGLISIIQTTTAAQTIGSTGNFDLSATGGANGGNGGTIFVSTGGALIVNPSSAVVTPGASGKGGSLTFLAGANLQINGALNVDGKGLGNGGYLELGSNSKTAFVLNSKTASNGVRGLLSVTAGSSGTTDGTIIIRNLGGAVTVSQALPNVFLLSASSGLAGALTVSAPVGTRGKTDTIALYSESGAISGAVLLQTNNLNLTSLKSNVSLTNIDVSAHVKAYGTVNGSITLTGKVGKNVTPGILEIGGLTATTGAMTITTAGGIEVSAASVASKDINLKTTSTTSVPFILGAGLQSTKGAVNITGSGNIDSGSAGTLSAQTNLKVTAGGAMTLAGALSAGAALSLTSNKDMSISGDVISAKGAVSLSSKTGNIDMNKADISAASTATLSASAGIVAVGSVGRDLQPKSLKVTALNGISNNGNVLGDGITVIPTGTITETVSGANQKLQVSTNMKAGTVTLNATGIGASIEALGTADISATKQVTVSATKGSATLVNLGITKAPDTLKVTALDSVQISGAMNANKSIAISATAKNPGNGNIILSATSNDPITLLTANNVAITRNGNIGDNGLPLKTNVGTNLVVNSSGGFVNVQNTGTAIVALSGSSATDSLSVTTAGPLKTVGTVSGTGVFLTGKGITISDNSVIGGANTANVVLNSNGADSKTVGTGLIQTTTSVSLRSTTGHSFGSGTDRTTAFQIDTPLLTVSTKGSVNAIDSNVINTGLTVLGTSTKSVTFVSTGDLTSNGALDNVTSISLQSDNGNIVTQQGAGKAGFTSSIKLDALAIGKGINLQGNTLIAKTININTFADFGSVGAGAVQIDGATTANIFSAGEVNVTNKGTAALTLNQASAGRAFTFSTSGSLTLKNVTAGNGDLQISSKGTLSTAAAATITAFNGSLTLLNTDASKGSIVVGAGSQVKTDGGSGGNVQILIGGQTAVVGNAPAGVNYNPTPSGQYLFGSNGIKVNNPTKVDMTVVGPVSIMFNTGSRPSSSITINGGTASGPHTLIKADPPLASVPQASISEQVGANSGALVIDLVAGPTAVTGELGAHGEAASPSSGISSAYTVGELPKNMLVISQSAGFVNLSSISVAGGSKVSLNSGELQASLSSAASLSGAASIHLSSPLAISTSSIQGGTGANLSIAPTINLTSPAFSSIMLNGHSIACADEAEFITETELANGEIPAGVMSEFELGLSSDSRHAMRPVALTEYGALSAASHVSKSMLVVANENKFIRTAFGDISISAGSLVLVLNLANGVAVYDLDDTHRGAVKVTARNHEFNLFPGTSVTLSSSSVTSFEEINPAQLFAYRNLSTHEVGADLKAFSSEFYVPMALRVVQPLKQLVNSKHPNAKKISSHLLKTTVAGLQMRAKGEQFKQIPRKANYLMALR